MGRTANAEDVFRAIADPTRREILDILADGSASTSELVSRFPISQSAVSQHLAVLRTAGLVTSEPQGRRRINRLDASGLREIVEWLERYERFWDQAFDRLGTVLDASGGPRDQP